MSATNSLTVRLGLSGLANVEGGLARLKGGVKALGPAIAGAGAVLAGLGAGVGHFTQRAIENADALSKMSERTGISTEQLSALGYAGKMADVSLADLETGLKFFAKSQVEAGRGSEDFVEALAGVADQFAGLEDGASKMDLAAKLFGKGGTGLIPLLNQGAAGLRQAAAEAREFGVIVDGQTAKAAAEFNDNLTKLKVASEGTAPALARDLVPALKSLSDTALAVSKSGTLKALAGELKPVADYLAAEVRKGVGQWIAGTQAAGSFFGSLAAGMSVTGALREAMRDSSEAFAEYRKGFDEVAEAAGGADKAVRQFVAAQDESARRLRLSIAGKDAALVGVNSDRSLTAIQQRAEAMELLQGKLEAVRKLEAELQANAPADARIFTDEQGQVRATEAQLRFQEQSVALARERLTVEAEIARLGADPTSIKGQLGETMRQLKDEFPTVAQSIARGFRSVIGSAVDGVAGSIGGLIRGTMTWGDALRNIGGSILNGVIDAISRMFAEWIVGRLAVKAVEIASTAAELPFLGLKALFQSIGSWGVAALVGTAALGVAIAGISGAFAEGGRPPVGRPALVGERGPELFIPDRPGLIIPADRTAAMLKASAGPVSATLSKDSASVVGSNKTELALFMDQGAMARWVDKHVEARVIQVIEGHSHRI